MRLSSIPWLLCAASSTVSAATDAAAAKVVVFDTQSPPSSASAEETVDPDTARLILAQRMGLGEYHSISTVDEDSIRQINAFSSQQQPLFRHDKHAEPVRRLLVMVNGVDYDADEHLKNSITQNARSFSIAPAPHPADALELFKTFTSEAWKTPRTDDADARLHDFLRKQKTLPPAEIQNFDGHDTMLRFTVTKDQSQALRHVIGSLSALALDYPPSSFTFVFIPAAASSTKPSKSPFGLQKRDSKALRAPQEKPLISGKAPSAASASEALTPPEPVSPNLASKPLSGPIPTCFPSLHACERATNNCTAHGECILKWSTDTTNDGGSVSKQDCFGCACTKPEVRHNKDGTKKTTKFGGAACHKKDIVFPFWLLAGTTVGIIGLITFGLGMLYEMGSQELPSVIGAGVSGPKAGGR